MFRKMTSGATWLAWLTLLGAGLLLAHVVLLIRTARAATLAPWQRALAWLPPLTPAMGWLAGSRVWSALWVALALAYAILRATPP
jgi:hypothetical protein